MYTFNQQLLVNLIKENNWLGVKKLMKEMMAVDQKVINDFMAVVQDSALQEPIRKMNETARQKLLDTWISGVYGLNLPGIACTTADKIIYRNDRGELEFLFANRGTPCQWGQDGLPMATIGGFFDSRVGKDRSVYDTANREVKEEVGKITAKLQKDNPIITSAPKNCHYWDPKKGAVDTGILAQDTPTVTLNFLAEYQEGELNESNEAQKPRWVSISKIMEGPFLMAFDHAKVLAEAIERLTGRKF
ncbi:MAG: NUDIX hydrolase [Patescibacteria group bacterium]